MRRSSYSSYSTRSYSSGSYRRRNRRNDGNGKTVVIIILICIIVLGAAAGACAYFGVFDKLFGAKQESTDESSSASEVQQSSEKKEESSAAAGSSSAQESESSAEESSKPELSGEFDENVFIYDKQGYQIFYGTEDTTASYASAVSSIKKSVGKDVNVYAMSVPTHSLFALPEKYKSLGTDEKAVLSSMYKSLGKDIKTIDVAASLEKHKDEYIYFGTDHNWTALGAYYGYVDFCKAAGVEAIDIKKLSTGTIKGFEGSLTAATKTDKQPDGNKVLLENPDTVTYYNIPGNRTCTLLENGKSEPEEVPMIATFAEGSNSYSAFIWGNNPYMHIKTTLKTGRKLCIIKDSYGCAFAPFTTANFDEVYIVDPAYYNGNVIDYIKKNKYTDVLIINSIMTPSTAIRTDELKTIID